MVMWESEIPTSRKDCCESDRTTVVGSAEGENPANESLMQYDVGSARSGGTRHEACTTMSIVGLEPTIDCETCNRMDWTQTSQVQDA